MPEEFYGQVAHHLPPEGPVGRRGGRPPIPHREGLRVIRFVPASGCRWGDVRNGTANLVVASEPLLDRRTVKPTGRRRVVDFAGFVAWLVEQVHEEVGVLVMDDINTREIASLYEAFPPERARRISERLEIATCRSTARG